MSVWRCSTTFFNRLESPERFAQMRRKRWEGYVHPKQVDLLELSRHEDLSTLSPAQIADKLSITGPYRGARVRSLIKRLQAKELLPPEVSRDYSYQQSALIELSKTHDLTRLSLQAIADLVDIRGPHRDKTAWYHLNQLKKKGIIST